MTCHFSRTVMVLVFIQLSLIFPSGSPHADTYTVINTNDAGAGHSGKRQ